MNDAQYGYDATSQLSSAVYDKLPAEAYDYDANGNRKAYETGKNNQLTSDGVFRYIYDDEGNRIEKRSKDSSTRYEWDHRNRLVRVLDKAQSVEYNYDYQNRLVCRNDELFVHDGWQVACSLKNGRIAHRYLWGAVQDELLAMDDNWTLRDHLNTVRKVVDMKGKVVSHLDYNAFGKLVSSTGDKPLFRYTGKMFDDAIDLQWNINRWYDAEVGRWISEDPIGFEGKDANLCRYVSNRSVSTSDPYGLLGVVGATLIAAGVVALTSLIVVYYNSGCTEHGDKKMYNDIKQCWVRCRKYIRKNGKIICTSGIFKKSGEHEYCHLAICKQNNFGKWVWHASPGTEVEYKACSVVCDKSKDEFTVDPTGQFWHLPIGV